jgi:hypothetical protein
LHADRHRAFKDVVLDGRGAARVVVDKYASNEEFAEGVAVDDQAVRTCARGADAVIDEVVTVKDERVDIDVRRRDENRRVIRVR